MTCSALKVLSWCGAIAGLIAGGLVAPTPSARAAGVLDRMQRKLRRQEPPGFMPVQRDPLLRRELLVVAPGDPGLPLPVQVPGGDGDRAMPQELGDLGDRQARAFQADGVGVGDRRADGAGAGLWRPAHSRRVRPGIPGYRRIALPVDYQ